MHARHCVSLLQRESLIRHQPLRVHNHIRHVTLDLLLNSTAHEQSLADQLLLSIRMKLWLLVHGWPGHEYVSTCV